MNPVLVKENTYKCKVVLLGEQSVGKSSLVLRFVKKMFVEYHAPTIGAAFLTKHVPMEDCTIKFEIWDTAGQERFHSITPMYYRGAQAAIVVYDITKPESFERAKAWVRELYLQANSEMVIMLAGNKIDLANERIIQYKDAADYAKGQNLLFIETSAKTERNVDALFHEIGKHCPRNVGAAPRQASNSVPLAPTESKPRTCCQNS